MKKNKCLICKRVLNNPSDPYSVDCGGDCIKCMAECGDPDCIKEVEKIKNKIIKKSMDEFKKMGGGSNPIEVNDPKELKEGLEKSFQELHGKENGDKNE